MFAGIRIGKGVFLHIGKKTPRGQLTKLEGVPPYLGYTHYDPASESNLHIEKGKYASTYMTDER